jgi:hypothetical protein
MLHQLTSENGRKRKLEKKRLKSLQNISTRLCIETVFENNTLVNLSNDEISANTLN